MDKKTAKKKKTRWERTKWGWDTDQGAYAAQVYDEDALWRIFKHGHMIAEGTTSSTRTAKMRSWIVLVALAAKRAQKGDEKQ